MDIYLQIKNSKGEIFKIVNLGRKEYLESFKSHLKKISNENDTPVFLNDFKIDNYLDSNKVKALMAEIKIIGKLLAKDLENYKAMLEKRTKIEENILNNSSIKNLMLIGKSRLLEIEDEIDKCEFEEQLKYINNNVNQLNENEEILNNEREQLKFLFDIELLFETLFEAKNFASGVYII